LNRDPLIKFLISINEPPGVRVFWLMTTQALLRALGLDRSSATLSKEGQEKKSENEGLIASNEASLSVPLNSQFSGSTVAPSAIGLGQLSHAQGASRPVSNSISSHSPHSSINGHAISSIMTENSASMAFQPQPIHRINSIPSNSSNAPTSPTSFSQELDEFYTEVQSLKDRIHAFKIQQTQVYTEEISCMTEIGKKRQQMNEFGQYLGNTTDLDEKREGKLCLLNIQNDLNALSRLFPKPAHFMLRWSLGSANFTLPEAQKVRYKTEYEAFKLHCTVYNFVLSLLNIFVFHFLIMDLLQYFFLLYFYCSMTIREHILLVNGSKIRSWWLIHHYLSILLTGTVLIWPYSSSLLEYRLPFLYYNLYLSAVQYLQYRYQMKRLYTLRALSKIGPMDITTDSAQVHVRNNLTFLLPFLLIAHLLQYYHAYLLWQIWNNTAAKEWQPIAIAMLYCLLATGNLTVTLYTYFQKIHRTTYGRNILHDSE
jgi:hypothetical protein